MTSLSSYQSWSGTFGGHFRDQIGVEHPQGPLRGSSPPILEWLSKARFESGTKSEVTPSEGPRGVQARQSWSG